MNKVKIQIEGTIYEVEQGKSLLHTCLALGFDVPYFCYHPAMGSVGACRQCAVKKYRNADDKKGRIVMSCMEPVVDGLIISISDQEAREFRALIIESLMTNHPHDCPVCDEGGECHLQDMTVMTGHAYRRFEFRKRTHLDQYLGPYIAHEMNRCIQCYRCVRFYRDYAGGRDFHVFGSANRVYFGRFENGKLESEFSGNLVEVCPTGVFTDKTLREHYTRKWDLTNSPSICTGCSIGCNIIIGERYGIVRRIMNRYNAEVNSYFICDRGRFGYGFIHGTERIRKVMIRSGEMLTEDQQGIYSDRIASLIKGKKVAGVGSPLASLESNSALEALTGKDNFYHGTADNEFRLVKAAIKIMRSGFAHTPSLRDIEQSDAVLILGEDLENAPRLALSVRQAARNKAFDLVERAGVSSWHDTAVRDMTADIYSPLFIASQAKTIIDDVAEWTYIADTGEISNLGEAIAKSVSGKEPEALKPGSSADEIEGKIAHTLLYAKRPLIVTGIKNNDIRILQAAANIAKALSNAGINPSLSIVFPEANSLGLGLMDGKPFGDLGKTDDIDTLVILENDLYRLDEKEKIDRLLSRYNIIVLNHSNNATTERADVLLPAGTFAESTGTIVSNEGRAQRYYRVLPEDGTIKDSWKLLSGIAEIAGTGEKLDHFDDALNSLVKAYPVFSKIVQIIPDSEYKYFSEKVARQTARFSGRTAMNANVSVNEPAPPPDNDSVMKFSMEGFKGITPANLTPYYWSPGWNSPQAINKYLDEPAGDSMDGNPGVLLFENIAPDKVEYFETGSKK